MGLRGPKPRLTEKDKAVLVDLYFARCMTGTQLQIYCFGEKSRYAQVRLKQLRERGYITCFQYAQKSHDRSMSFKFDEGINTLVYELTDAGLREVEGILGQKILSAEEGGGISGLTIRSHSVGRYLQTAEIYLKNKKRIKWLPHFLLRHEIESPDWTVACLAGAKQKNETLLLFGVNKEPHLNTFKTIENHIKNASSFQIRRHILLCPNYDTAEMAIKFYDKKVLSGELHVMTYQAAQEDLLFVYNGCEEILLEELRNFYGRWCQVFEATGRNSALFEKMFEHKPHIFTYFADLSTGNLRTLGKVLMYDHERAESDAALNNGSVRTVYALVKDHEQFDFLKGFLTRHRHVRLILRDVPGRPIYGCTKTGDWVQVEKPVQRTGGR